ncbi:S1 family peptidase [Demequina aurantiaca]|uniref:S1 family peptidase n=1 Tax=Demequina aurantiaca TaxID=676200 RepID=UPI003D327F79
MKRRAVAATAAACALALGGCSMLPEAPGALPTSFVPAPTVSPGEGPGALSPDGFTSAQRMTVRVRNVGCGFLSTGTGFALDEHTLITNRHVIEDSKKLQLQTYDGRSITATTVASTTVADIAIVTTEESLGGTFAAVASEDPVESDVITVVGYPEGGRLKTVSGVVIGPIADPLGSAVGTVLATTAVVEPGSSGSPALNEDGEVVGVVYAKNDASQSFIVPVSTLASLLEETSLLVPEPAQC